MVKVISRRELLDLIFQRKDFKLVDVLNAEHYEQEHILGAISLPLEEIGQKAKNLLREDELTIVYCASFDCTASTRAAEKLMALGYKRVFDYKGGLKDYEEGSLPLEGSLHQVSEKEKVCVTCGGPA